MRAALSPSVILAAMMIGLATLMGPFRTMDAFPLPQRAVFWTVLISWNMLKWHLWQAAVAAYGLARLRAGVPARLVGAVLLCATIPWEIAALAAAVGRPVRFDILSTYLSAVALSLSLTVVLEIARARRGSAEAVPSPAGQGEAGTPGKGALIDPDGSLARAGVRDPQQLLAVVAEDHYVRLYLRSGERPLLYHRFRDTMAELKHLDGEQVNRGKWVAAHAVTAAARRNRKWDLVLADGSTITVSEQHVERARRRGWLR
jgi:hypothetical protein